MLRDEGTEQQLAFSSMAECAADDGSDFGEATNVRL